MEISKRWALPLALIGGLAVGAAMTLRRKTAARHNDRQHKLDLQDWEGEGGSLATPAAAQPQS